MTNLKQEVIGSTGIQPSKKTLREQIANDVSHFLANGGAVTTIREKKQRRVYRNPCARSPMTLNRISVDRVNRVAQIKNLFPSSLDPSVRFAVERGWKTQSHRRVHLVKTTG